MMAFVNMHRECRLNRWATFNRGTWIFFPLVCSQSNPFLFTQAWIMQQCAPHLRSVVRLVSEVHSTKRFAGNLICPFACVHVSFLSLSVPFQLIMSRARRDWKRQNSRGKHTYAVKRFFWSLQKNTRGRNVQDYQLECRFFFLLTLEIR